jgi:hypothetical protein
MALQLYKIASTELNASASNITFSSIPQGYTDLKIVLSMRSDANSTSIVDYVKLNFNSSSSYWTYKRFSGNGVTASSGSQVLADTTAWTLSGLSNGSSSDANTFCNAEIYIPNYTSSNKKAVSVDTATESNTASAITYQLTMLAGLWEGTAAVSTISLTSNAGNFVQYSTATLYGIL